MSAWSDVAARLNTRRGVLVGAAALLGVSLVVGGLVSLSHGPEARASIRSASLRRTSVVSVAQTTAATPVVAPVMALQDLSPQDALAANQAVPFSTLPNPAAKPFQITGASDDDKAKAETCLAQAVYYEAGFEPLAGEQAVAQVVLNRLRHPVYPKTVCGVVFQGSELKTGCQFTFTCDGALGRPPEPAAWTRAVAVAHAALNGFVMKSVGEATHYHTQYVVPYWSPTLVKLTQVGQHIFYRWTGAGGQPPAFDGRYAGEEPGSPDAPAVLPVQLLPAIKLAAYDPAKGPAQPATEAAASATAASATPAPAPSTPAAGAAEDHAPAPAPVVLTRIETPQVVAPPPKVASVEKTFVPAEGLVPRPKWRPF